MKLATFVAFFIVLIVLARWSSRRTADSTLRSPEEEAEYQRELMHQSATFISPSENDTVPPQKRGDLTLEALWFDGFNASDGPPDPYRFCDEMTVTFRIDYASVEYPIRRWDVHYVVATPEGMRDKLDKEKWGTMYLPEVLIVNRYDLDQIRDFVFERTRDDDPDLSDRPVDSILG